MILEQNYIKIIEYSQKAFKIFCRRSLASAIIKTLQKRNNREKQKFIDDNDDNNNLVNGNIKIASEKSLIYLPPTGEEVFDGESIVSDAKRTQNNMERYEQDSKNTTIIDRLEIMYGDLVYIEFNHKNSNENMRAKHFLNKLKFLPVNEIGVGASSDLRCVFEVVYPGINLQTRKKGTLVNQSCLICFRSISKQQYLKVKSSKTAYSEEFGKELQLTKELSECSVFEIKYAQKITDQAIVSGEKILIKMFGEQLYMNVIEDESEIFFSQTPAEFKLKKLAKKIQNFIPQYYKITSKKFDAGILGNPTDLQNLSQKKQMLNVVAVNQMNISTKINPITFTQFDFNKVIEQDPKFDTNRDTISNSVLNCWQLIECPSKNQNNFYHLYNPISGQGLIIKPLKNAVKLTPNVKEFTPLKVNRQDEDAVYFSTQNMAQQLDIIFERTTEKHMMVISKTENSNKSKLINIKQICTKNAYMVCEMTQILDVMRQTYDFLNTWGNEVDQKLQTVLYSVKQIHLGSSMMIKKVRQMRMAFKILKNYLQNPQYSIIQIQNLINSMKILQLIINLCKVITNKIGFNYPHLQSDVTSPFCFAKDNLEKILKSLFWIILRMTTDNIYNSNVVISEVNFFNKILIAYPEQIGQILQEAIKNLSTFSTKTNANGSNELFLWVKLIQPLRQDNIRIQKTYIDIIAQVVVDPNDKGIIQYQNKCQQLLFISSSKRKGIPKFGIDEESKKPIVVFENQAMMSDFLQKNQHLSKLNLVHLNSASYFIEGFFSDRLPSTGSISDQYVGYIGSIIKMFRNLRRNRNKKLSKIVVDWGITQQHIQAIFNCKHISWGLKTNYLSLWTTIYIDEDPFLSFEKRQTKCHSWQKIHKYNLQDCTAIIFKQYTDQNLAINKLNEFGPKIYPVLSNFFEQFLISRQSIFLDDQMMRCLPIVLNTIYQMMNLGYMTLKSMKQYLSIILFISTSIVDKNANSKKPIEPQLTKFHRIVISKTIKILQLYEDIWVQIYGVSFLKKFYENSQSKKYTLSRQHIQEQWEEILKNKFDQIILQASKQASLRKRTRFTAISQNQNTIYAQKSKNFQLRHGNYTFEQVDNQILDFTINLLSKRMLEDKCGDYQELGRLINKKITRRERICSYMKEIMILSNERQEEIYRNFSGRESNKLLNWLKIQQIVLKITQIELGNSNDELQSRNKKQKILQLNNILVKINRQMNNYKLQNSNLLHKCQLILQKLNVHKVLLDLLKYSQKVVYKQLIKTIFVFFCYFITDNEANCNALVPHVDKFIRNLNYEQLVDIIPILIQKNQDKDSAYKIAHQLIFKINKNQITLPLLRIIDRVLNLYPNSQNAQQFKNHLSRRIIDHLDLKTQLKQLQKTHSNEQQRMIYSFEFIKILCKLASTCPELQKQIKNIYSKCGLLEKLKNCENYEEKSLYLKILVEIYIRCKQLQNFEIEDYFKVLVLKEIQKIPNIWIKLVQKKTLTHEKQAIIHSLYDQLLSYTQVRIQTKDEQAYFNYILDQKDVNQISILAFCKIILLKWKGNQRSQRLQKCRNYLKKLQKFLFVILYEQNSAYQRSFFSQIQSINLGLENICVENHQEPKEQKTLDQGTKQQIIKFYQKLSKIIMQQGISAHELFNCFGIDSQHLYMRRSNLNIINFITQLQFMHGFDKLKKLLHKKQQFETLINSSELFRFIYVIKDKKTRNIDIYFFMQKLISVLQYNKNMKIKQQISNNENLIEESEDINQSYLTNLNTYIENEDIHEKQFMLQVKVFCEISESCQTTILERLKKKVRNIVMGLDKKLINQWINDPSLNIYKLSQTYPCSVIYAFVLTILEKSIDISNENISIQNVTHIKSVIQYLRHMNLRFQQKPQINLLIVLSEIFLRFQGVKDIVQKYQRLIQKMYQKIIQLIFMRKCQQNVELIKHYRILFIDVVNNVYTSESYKIRMKYKMMDTIKRLIVKGINLSCGYSFNIMEALLLMWSENELADEVQNGKLMQDPQFINWVEIVLSSKSLKQMVGVSTKHVNKANFALLIVKTIIKYEQNYDSDQKILKNSILKIQKQSTKLFQQIIIPKKAAHIEQLYCLNYQQCSQTFCNYDRLTQNDQNMLNLLLSLFMISRLYLAKNHHSIPKNVSSEEIDWQIQTMAGHIKYRLYDRDKNYNFKLPSYHLFNNPDTQRIIMEQVSKIPGQNLYMYLHALSKIYMKQIGLISTLYHKLKPIKFLLTHQTIVKYIILFIFIVSIVIHLNSSLLDNLYYKNQNIGNPFLKIFCLIAFIINLFHFGREVRTFVNKYYLLYPLKYAQINGQINHQSNGINLFKKVMLNKKEENTKTMVPKTRKQIGQFFEQINSSSHNIQSENHNKINNENEGNQKYRLTLGQTVNELFDSMIPAHFFLLFFYIFSVFQYQFLIFLIFLQVIDIKKARQLIRICGKALSRMVLYYCAYAVILDLSFVFFAFEQVYLGKSFGQICSNYLIKVYNIFLLGNMDSNALSNGIEIIDLISQIYFFFVLIHSLFYLTNEIFLMEKHKEKVRNRCCICLKTKKQIQGKKENFNYHIKNQHKIWDYLYFFIEFDRKGKLEGINSQIEQQIRKGDYRFLRLS